MTLAKDILRAASGGVELSPPHPPRQKRNYIELATAAEQKHAALKDIRATGLFGISWESSEGLYRTSPKFNGSRVFLGAFTCAERASIAIRLYTLWHNRGYHDIPTGKYCGYIDYDRHVN